MIDEQYKEAYESAPEETRKSIQAFMSKPKAFRDKKPLLYYVLGSGTPPYKMSKKDSLYVDNSTKRQKCSNCIFTYIKYVDNKPICSQIRGTIKLGGWCKLWRGEE
jgi:hypothetical protein